MDWRTQSRSRCVPPNHGSSRFLETLRGKIPFGLDVLHRCDMPMCVNPDHLFVGTAKDNIADMVTKNRYAKIKPRGEKHGNTKLSDRDFLEIFQLRGHMFVWEIAQAYGITPAYVSHIQLGRYKR